MTKIISSVADIASIGLTLDNETTIEFRIPQRDFSNELSKVKWPIGIKNINFTGCAGLTEISSLPTDLRDLDLNGCSSLTALPTPLDHILSINLRGCSSLTALPTIPDNIGDIDLRGCNSLPNTAGFVGQLLELERRQFSVIWPDHIDRDIDIANIKNLPNVPSINK